MKRNLFKLAVAIFAISTASSAIAGELMVVNDSSYPFIRFYARNNAFNELWTGPMENNPIYPGESRTFYFNTRGSCSDWNIEVDTAPNIMTKFWNVSVCGGVVWTVRDDIIGNAGTR